MRIVPAEPAHAAAWDRFVAARDDATFFHQAAMPGLVARTFRHRDRSLVALQDGAVAGILPLVEMRTLLFGHALVSLPFCVYAGPLAADGPTMQALLDAAIALRTRTGAASLELRDLVPEPAEPSEPPPPDPAWTTRPGLYATFRRAIAADPDTNLKAIPRKQRAVLRRGLAAGLDTRTTGDPSHAWRIYAESVRNLGSPVVPERWFHGLAATFPGAVDATLVAKAGRTLAAVLSFHWRDQVLPYYGGGIPAARTEGAYDVMYWRTLCDGASRGARLFDFGRSKQGTGAFAFKKNWGFPPTPLDYRFNLAPGRAIPEHNPLNPKYRAMIATWKRLPLPVANRLGPVVVRGVG